MATEDKADVIIVGAGPAGIAAAITLAKAGLTVVIFERGEYPGSKNVFGGILFTTILEKLTPDFLKADPQPVERHVTKRGFSVLSKDSELYLSFQSEEFNKPPYNHSFTALRAKFDKWFAQQVEAAGALLVTSTVVDDVIEKGGKIVGVKTRRENGDMYADVVIIAEGANSFIAEKRGWRKKFNAEHMIVGAKMVIGLPSEIIEDRFNLEKDEGLAIEYFGDAVLGMVGSGFIYTNKESLSVGMGVTIESINKTSAAGKPIRPQDVLDYLTQHPCVKNLLRGGQVLEYSAHMIPEYPMEEMPKFVHNGCLLVGDAAGFININPIYQEGTNFAMASGLMAAETILDAKKKGNFSEKTLSAFTQKLEKSFVMQDVRKNRKLPAFGAKNPQFFTTYPDAVLEAAQRFFTVDDQPKRMAQKLALRTFFRKANSFRLVVDTIKAIRAMF